MKVLFIGGTGVISSGCAALAVESGIELSVLNRGTPTSRPLSPEVRELRADIRDPASVRSALGAETFDVVVDWVAFTPEHVQNDIDIFTGRTAQYVFISTAATYEKPPRLPITESTPQSNPQWPYAVDKIACERLLGDALRDASFPSTVVRPSHTYDRTAVPFDGGWTIVDRMRRGKEIVVHGDGTSLWVLTHHRDFAKGFLGLLGNGQAIGESFHITSDEVLTWNQIAAELAAAAGVEARVVHVASDTIAATDPAWGESLRYDKMHSVLFDNSKLRAVVPEYAATVPFAQGAREIVGWHDEAPERRVIDARLDAAMDSLIETYRPGSA